VKISFKSHIFTFCKQKLWVNNPELLNLHKRLLVQSLILANFIPMTTICQHLYTFVEEVKFTRKWDFTWRVSDCEELVGVTHRRWWRLFCKSDPIEIIWCSRSTIVPRGSVWWSDTCFELKLSLKINKVSSTNPYLKINLLQKETFVLKKPLTQAQFSPFFKNYMYLR